MRFPQCPLSKLPNVSCLVLTQALIRPWQSMGLGSHCSVRCLHGAELCGWRYRRVPRRHRCHGNAPLPEELGHCIPHSPRQLQGHENPCKAGGMRQCPENCFPILLPEAKTEVPRHNQEMGAFRELVQPGLADTNYLSLCLHNI